MIAIVLIGIATSAGQEGRMGVSMLQPPIARKPGYRLRATGSLDKQLGVVLKQRFTSFGVPNGK